MSTNLWFELLAFRVWGRPIKNHKYPYKSLISRFMFVRDHFLGHLIFVMGLPGSTFSRQWKLKNVISNNFTFHFPLLQNSFSLVWGPQKNWPLPLLFKCFVKKCLYRHCSKHSLIWKITLEAIWDFGCLENATHGSEMQTFINLELLFPEVLTNYIDEKLAFRVFFLLVIER